MTKRDVIPALSVDNFTVTTTGLVAKNGATFEEWMAFGSGLQRVDAALQWVIGDWLNYGERKYGEKYAQALTLWPEKDYQTLRDYKWVAARIPVSSREDNLSFSHHKTVAPLPPEQQTKWLGHAFEKSISANNLRKEIIASGGKLSTGEFHVSTGEYEWYTPPPIVEAARAVMGRIDLDPASCDEANAVVQADVIYTKVDDGLTREWGGRVWMNPPYCMPEIENFTARAIRDYEDGKIAEAVILVNNATDTAWFQCLLRFPVCFTLGRVPFRGPGMAMDEKTQPRQGQAIFYLGTNVSEFVDEFSKFGTVMVRHDNS